VNGEPINGPALTTMITTYWGSPLGMAGPSRNVAPGSWSGSHSRIFTTGLCRPETTTVNEKNATVAVSFSSIPGNMDIEFDGLA